MHQADCAFRTWPNRRSALAFDQKAGRGGHFSLLTVPGLMGARVIGPRVAWTKSTAQGLFSNFQTW